MASNRRSVLFWPLFVASGLAVAFMPAMVGATKAMQAKAAAYAQRNGLPMKRVDLNAGGRPVSRIFVPVLANTAQDFAREFNAAHGAVVVRQSARDLIHQTLLFGFGDGYGYAQNGTPFHPQQMAIALQHLQHGQPNWQTDFGGRYVVMALSPGEIQHLRGFLDAGQRGRSQPSSCPNGGCLWWYVHAEVGPNQPLAWAMGVKRSRHPATMTSKLVHAGNQRVSVVGIPVDKAETFERMSRVDLLGAPPSMGAGEAVR